MPVTLQGRWLVIHRIGKGDRLQSEPTGNVKIKDRNDLPTIINVVALKKRLFLPCILFAFSFHHSCWFVKCSFASVSALDLITVTLPN